MRVRLAAAAAIVCAAAYAAPAAAQLRVLAPEGRIAGAPALVGDRVLWAAPRAGFVDVVAAPAAGGPVATLGAVPLAADDAVALAAGPDLLALQLRDSRDLAAEGRLFVAGTDGAFRLRARNVGGGPIFPYIPAMQATAAGVLTLEDGVAAFLRPGAGPNREVALPPGSDPERVAAAGHLAVTPSPEGALIVFDVGTDLELRQISLGRYDPGTINGLAISPEGDVAATVPTGDGEDVLLWAPARSERVRVLATGREYGRVATAGGRVAFAAGDGLRDGERLTVIDAATRRTLFRGPPAFSIDGLSFDGRTIAFATPGCTLIGPVWRRSSRRTLPPGECVRTDVAVSTANPAVRGNRYGVRVACINAPARACRVSARLTSRGRSAGRADARVRRGSTRLIEIPLRARRGRLRLTVRVTDPDGRTRTVYDF